MSGCDTFPVSICPGSICLGEHLSYNSRTGLPNSYFSSTTVNSTLSVHIFISFRVCVGTFKRFKPFATIVNNLYVCCGLAVPL